jgi:uncharacterized RDD family membrane protein YckC
MDTKNPYAPPSAPVRDIPSEASTQELAGRGSRLGATLLDGLVLGLLCYIPMMVAIDWRALASNPENIDPVSVFLNSRVLLAALPGLVIFAAVTIWLVLKNSQTIGKKLVGIKVVRSDGSRAGLGRLFWLRNVVMNAIGFIPIVGGIVALVDILLIFRQSRKCLHDQIADTIVIKA